MKKISQKGLTLVELIVASLLIGIVLLGIVSFNLSISRIQSDSSSTSNLSLQAASAMSYLRNDIAEAKGNVGDSGFVELKTGNNRSLCIRKPAGANPWVCYLYTKDTGGTGNTGNLTRCTPTGTTQTIPPASFNNTSLCSGSVTFIARLQAPGQFFELVGGNPPQYVNVKLQTTDGHSTSSVLSSNIIPLNHTR